MYRYRTDLIAKAQGEKTDYEVAAYSGVSPDTVKRARKGANLSVKSLSAIAKALSLNMQDLFTFDRADGASSESARTGSLSLKN